MADAAQQAGESSTTKTDDQATATVVQEAPPLPPVQMPSPGASQPKDGQGPEAPVAQTSTKELAEEPQAANAKTDPPAQATSAPPPKAADGPQTIDNKVPIKLQVNVQGQASFGIPGEGAKKEFKDPTKELPSQIDIQAVTLEESKTLVEVLTEKRVIVLTSFEHQLAFAAAHFLAHQDVFKEYSRRLLVVARRDERADVTIDLFGREEYHEKQKQLILVELNHDGIFLDSLRTRSCGEPAVLRDLLRRKDIALICAVSFEILGVTPQRPNSDSLPFYQHEISYLAYRLAQCFPESEALELKDRLIRLRQKGLWITAAEEDFLRQVSGCLKSPGNLKAEIERREKLATDAAPSLPEASKPLSLDTLIGDGDELRLAVLYTATYFPGLTPNDFEKMVCLILGKSTKEVEKESQIITEKGKVLTRKEPVTRPLVEIWRESPDRILRDCHLETVSRSDSVQVVGFSSSNPPQDPRSYLELRQPMFVARTFRRLQETGLLFDQEISEAVVDNLVRLSVNRTIADPSYYDKGWLIGIIFMLKVHLASSENLEDPSQDFFLLIARLRENELLRRHFYGRLCQLIREMLRHESLRGTVEGFLDFLVASREHDTALDIVLELSRRLRFAQDFETFSWMRRLLEQDDEHIRERTYACLYELMKESGIRLYDVLEAIRGWLPARPLEEKHYTPSHRHALAYLPAYCLKSAFDFQATRYGEWPTRYSLFAALPEEALARPKLALLAEWLSHPGLKAVVRVEGIPPEEWLAYVMADLIEQWILILEGLVPEKTHPEARRMADALLRAFAGRFAKPQRTLFVRRWQSSQQDYYQQVNRLPVQQREERGELLAKRKKVLDLKQRFQQFESHSLEA
jgi:hypothetical protein